MLRKFPSIVVLSSLLLTAPSYARYPTESDKLYDKGTQLAAALTRTVDKPGSSENKWWADFEKSGEVIAVYINELASKDSEAAMWFLVTGGKFGFSSRQATPQEEQLLLSAMQKVAKSFASSNNPKEGYEKWIGMEAARQAGHHHLAMIYQQIDDLKKANESLSLRVSSLEVKNSVLEERILGVQNKNVDLEARLVKAESKLEETEKKLDEARKTFMDEISTQRAQHKSFMEELKKQREDFFEEQRKQREAFQAQMMNLTAGNLQLTTLFGNYSKTCDEKIDRHLKENDAKIKELKDQNDSLLETLVKRERRDKEIDAALSNMQKTLAPISNIERLSDKSLEINFDMFSIISEIQRLISLRVN